jgi:hypothetical protein
MLPNQKVRNQSKMKKRVSTLRHVVKLNAYQQSQLRLVLPTSAGNAVLGMIVRKHRPHDNSSIGKRTVCLGRKQTQWIVTGKPIPIFLAAAKSALVAEGAI